MLQQGAVFGQVGSNEKEGGKSEALGSGLEKGECDGEVARAKKETEDFGWPEQATWWQGNEIPALPKP